MVIAGAIRRKSYYRTLSMSLLIATLPLILLALSIYFIGIKRIEKEISAQFERYYAKIAGNLDQQLQEIEILGFQWGFNTEGILKYMGADFPREFMVARRFQESLLRISTLNPLISQTYFWSPADPNGLLFSSGSDRLDSEDIRPDLIHELINALKDVRKIQWSFKGVFREVNREDETILLFVKVPTLIHSKNGILLLEIHKDRLIRLLSPGDMDGSTSGESVILLGEEGEIIAYRGDPESYYQNRPIIDDALQRGDSGVLLRDGRFFLYQRIKNDQWVALSIMESGSITKPVTEVAQIMMLLVLVLLLTSVALSVKASQTIYQPIKRMMDALTGEVEPWGEKDSEIDIINRYLTDSKWEKKRLIKEIGQYKYENKIALINQLLNGDFDGLCDGDIRNKIGKSELTFEHKKVGILVIQFQEETYLENQIDVNIMRFSAVSLIRESLLPGDAYILPCQEKMIALIVPVSRESASPKAKLWPLANRIRDTLAKELNIHTTLAMSDIVNDMSKLHQHYRKTIKTLSFRKIGQDDQIIEVNSVNPQSEEKIDYPYGLEKELIHALQLGCKEETLADLNLLMAHFTASSGTVYLLQQQLQLFISNLIFAVMQSGFDPWTIFKDRDLHQELSNLHQGKSIGKWIEKDVIEPFLGEINKLQDREYRRIISDIDDIINREYASPLFGLDYCAERLDTYPQKISSAFKKIRNVNFITYLTEFRMDKAKELLMNPDIPINCIASQVGYQPSYFNRLFKKIFAVTPGEYRNSRLSEF